MPLAASLVHSGSATQVAATKKTNGAASGTGVARRIPTTGSRDLAMWHEALVYHAAMNKGTRAVLKFGCEFLKPSTQNTASLPVESSARKSVAHDIDVSLNIMLGAPLTIREFGSRLFRRSI